MCADNDDADNDDADNVDDDYDYDDDDDDDDDHNGNDNDYYYVGDICKFRGSCKKYEQNHDQPQPPSLLLDMSSAEWKSKSEVILEIYQ